MRLFLKDMLIRPIITEKSLREAGLKRYAFRVAKDASKPKIGKAVEKMFGVKVLSVRTMTMPGKAYRTGKKWKLGRREDWKKAVVAIKPDQKIDLFEVGSQKDK